MSQRLFILDTNVLMHDPTAIFRFQEHDVYLPMVVLEELDAAKKGMSEVAQNVRQVSRFLDELITTQLHLKNGFLLPTANDGQSHGRLFFQTEGFAEYFLPDTLPGHKPDNSLLSAAIAIQHADPNRQVVLVSKDINLRIKAHALGIHAEDYINDRVIDDMDLLYPGELILPNHHWATHHREMPAQSNHTLYALTSPEGVACYPNQFLYDESGDLSTIVRDCQSDQLIVEPIQDFYGHRNNVWGITARNRGQNYALNLLMDPQIDFVTLVGGAGTGKTLLTLAAGLAQTLELQRYREIIVTRVTVPLGEDIGFLPGTEEEKMTPWMGALMDNLEVLNPTQGGGEWGRAATADLLHTRIKIRSLNFMRGRTFLNRYLIVDEAQNLTSKQLKALITRAGVGTKIICLGNLAQIDTPYLTETTSGLTYIVDRFKTWPHSGHLILQRGERSRLADFANQML